MRGRQSGISTAFVNPAPTNATQSPARMLRNRFVSQREGILKHAPLVFQVFQEILDTFEGLTIVSMSAISFNPGSQSLDVLPIISPCWGPKFFKGRRRL